MIQETSKQAYQSIVNSLGDRQYQVLQALEDMKVASNLDLSKKTRLPINSITPRVLELRKKGLVDEYGRDVHPKTNRTVIYWTVRT